MKLADGSVRPAGKCDVQIDHKGLGNAAAAGFSAILPYPEKGVENPTTKK